MASSSSLLEPPCNPMFPDDVTRLPSDRGYMPVPTYPNFEPKRLDVYHPNLADCGAMLTFVRASNGGVLYNLVYYSCCIIAGNCWDDSEIDPSQRQDGRDGPDLRSASPNRRNSSPNITRTQQNDSSSTTVAQDRPYLSKSIDPTNINEIIPHGGLISEEVLYFHVPEGFLGIPHHPKYGYPITPNFENWIFPHGRVPKLWTDLPPYRDFSLSPTGPCRLTGSSIQVEVARMIPKTDEDWWLKNRMLRVINNTAVDIDCINNAFGLRADIRGIFDESTIVPFPKPADTGGIKLFACVQKMPLEETPRALWELIATYHNHQFHNMDWINNEFIFARFAWSKFCSAHFPLLTNSKLSDRSFYLATHTDSGKVEYREWNLSSRQFPWPRAGHGGTSGKKGKDTNGDDVLYSQHYDEEMDSDCEPEAWSYYLYKSFGGFEYFNEESSSSRSESSSTDTVRDY